MKEFFDFICGIISSNFGVIHIKEEVYKIITEFEENLPYKNEIEKGNIRKFNKYLRRTYLDDDASHYSAAHFNSRFQSSL